MPELTPFQTVGPFFELAFGAERVGQSALDGEGRDALSVEGYVRDGAGESVPDALIEAWHPGAGELVRVPTDDDGRYRIEIQTPEPLPGPSGATQAPHLVLGILARGVLTRLVTHVYFEDETSNADDPILALVPRERHETLVARRIEEGRYRFDIVLQGERETVFFDV